MLKTLQKALQSGLGVLEEGHLAAADESEDRRVPPTEAMRHQTASSENSAERTVKDMVIRMAQRINQGADRPLVRVGRQGQIMMENHLLFALGRADLNPDGMLLLRRLAGEFQNIPHNIRIEGHTDNIPIQTSRYPSNWELSTARAVRVVKYLANQGGIAPSRLMAAGYADVRPVRPNTSALNRAGNRRVEFFLLKGKVK